MEISSNVIVTVQINFRTVEWPVPLDSPGKKEISDAHALASPEGLSIIL